MKTFWSAQEIEELAARGQTELIIDGNTVLTDLARHTAQQLGITIIDRSRPAPVLATRPAPSPPQPAPPPVSQPAASRNAVPLGSKPKGCQHGPLTARQAPAEPDVRSGGSNTVVDQLVGAVRRLTGRGLDS